MIGRQPNLPAHMGLLEGRTSHGHVLRILHHVQITFQAHMIGFHVYQNRTLSRYNDST